MQCGIDQRKDDENRCGPMPNPNISFLPYAKQKYQQPRGKKANPREQNFTAQITCHNVQFSIPKLNQWVCHRPTEGTECRKKGPQLFAFHDTIHFSTLLG